MAGLVSLPLTMTGLFVAAIYDGGATAVSDNLAFVLMGGFGTTIFGGIGWWVSGGCVLSSPPNPRQNRRRRPRRFDRR